MTENYPYIYIYIFIHDGWTVTGTEEDGEECPNIPQDLVLVPMRRLWNIWTMPISMIKESIMQLYFLWVLRSILWKSIDSGVEQSVPALSCFIISVCPSCRFVGGNLCQKFAYCFVLSFFLFFLNLKHWWLVCFDLFWFVFLNASNRLYFQLLFFFKD